MGTTLTLASITTGDAGNYDVVVTGACGSVTSTAAHLTVYSTVPGDVDGNGSADGADINTFVSLLLLGSDGPPSAGFCAADINGDSELDMADVGLFAGILLARS